MRTISFGTPADSLINNAFGLEPTSASKVKPLPEDQLRLLTYSART